MSGEPTDAALRKLRRAARHQDPRSMLVPVGVDAQVLLFRGDLAGEAEPGRLRDAVAAVVDVMTDGPGVQIEAVIGDRIGPEASPIAIASRLRRLGRYARQGGSDRVVWACRDSLAGLLEPLDPRHVATFVHGQIAGLADYDREHGTDLQRVLELALDHDRRGDAARAAFMHRNTFRRQLERALEIIDADLDSPEERLALHLALKVRRLAA